MNFTRILQNWPLLTVAVTVAHILYRLSSAHEDIGPGYKQHEIVKLRFEKDLVQPFLRFPDVLADCTGAIDLLWDKLLFIRCDRCPHGLVEDAVGSAAFLVD
ncbi:MAG: hypothetical protein JSV40_13670 [Deltaproteobacteria bacterium]|nr:MAG: hypothetical protein JSV40_13670 [Deltaproteobacteria bacterium]